ncbi:MAG: glycoside hydrolase family 5 protein, partial [Chloroflexi bacterium]|nr:glycoside hydrolase family 5 protein [Chloroflexota bacterium]
MMPGVRRSFVVAALALVSAAFFISYWSVPFAPPQSVTINCERDPASVPLRGLAKDGKPLVYLHTCGKKVYDSKGREVRITGINWFGMETETFAPHGLWSRNWESLLDQIAELGFNVIRLPYSNEMLTPGQMPAGIDYEQNANLKGLTSLEVLDKLLEGARDRGLRVILDRHRPTSAGQSPLWYTADVSEERWIQDWQMLALRYRGDDTLIGVDLHNEPKWEATWGTGDIKTDWRLAAERAGNAILDVNPYLLIFVQGVEKYRNDWYWWGGNLAGAAQTPVRLKVPNRVVYSPHDYGPEVFMQGWFYDPKFPDNLPDVWGKHWGYIHDKNLAPVVLGEFGGRSVGDDAAGQWQRTLVDYLASKGIGYINWSFNPNSADTNGLLGEDWETIVKEKQSL